MELIRPDTKIDFMKQARVLGFVSLGVVALAVLLMAVRGFNLGIDFKGGTVLQVAVPEEAGPVDEARIRSAVAAIDVPGAADAVIVRFGPAEDRSFLISLPTSQEEAGAEMPVKILDGLAKALGAPVDDQRIESIGARVGQELRARGFYAVLLSWGMILLYVWFRFDLRYAPGAVAALVHDVLITAGVFVALGLEFNLQVLAALLVVIGYSLNDTIVIYDRIRENLELRGTTHLEDVVNQSINQTLSRTLLTSLTTLLVVMALFVLGGPVIHDFALAMLIGVTVGTYSTIYVASSLLVVLERRFGGPGGSAGETRASKARARA
ncbi:MAG: protein translocase subunit SecF [Deltaproteobacteria bacterium]|nr:protein translocase subunit SecF [Deltaproteobacteria bacterium]MBW2414030.1 protein translocase subunit SecF [Deltaproteobacteria bacterium]